MFKIFRFKAQDFEKQVYHCISSCSQTQHPFKDLPSSSASVITLIYFLHLQHQETCGVLGWSCMPCALGTSLITVKILLSVDVRSSATRPFVKEFAWPFVPAVIGGCSTMSSDDDLVQSCSILFTYCCTSESFACGLHDMYINTSSLGLWDPTSICSVCI